MVEDHPLDPYEQQLLKVFDSYDLENRGSLDQEGLTQLCLSLQLEEQGNELIKCLLEDPKNPRVTFTEFKDALLTLLGNVQNNEDQKFPETDNRSPEREVSPKYVYGSKKYGRRSRPKLDEINFTADDQNQNFFNKTTRNITVQRSNSQSDVTYSKKRKTNYKLKRCTSFPGNHNYFQKSPENTLNNEQEFLCTEDMLRKAWKKLGVGEDGYLNQTELILVCDAIGLQKLAEGVIRQLPDKLAQDFEHKISFQELLEALQQDDTWSEVLRPISPMNVEKVDLTLQTDETVFPNSKLGNFIALGPEGTGFISAETLTEIWETAGITAPKLLLQDLGFSSTQINVKELATILEKELKSIDSVSASPHVVLLQAVLTLYQTEIRCLKNIVEQMNAEREKLKCDVMEANNRACLLAQEVDDNHARMEKTAQNEVKLLEQRHGEILKEVTEQFSSEKEQINHLNTNLQQKILCLENEEARLRNDISIAQKYSTTLEKENQSLTTKVSELQHIKNILSDQINILENEKQSCHELEKEHVQIEPLLTKLSELQVENSQLRDKNDEMLTEIESLSNQISSLRNKVCSTPTFHNLEQSMEENVSIICEGVGLGAKRRSGDSPSKDLTILGLGTSSPRLGKVRKCHKDKGDFLDIPLASSESGFDTELDGFDSSLSISATENEEVLCLQAKIAVLEQLLAQHSIPVPSGACSNVESEPLEIKLEQLTRRCNQLQACIIDIKSCTNQCVTYKDACGCKAEKSVQLIDEKLENVSLNEKFNESYSVDASTETETFDFDETISRYAERNETLVKKCQELDGCVELLREEYEKCEDYWSAKLNQERQMFEQEQSQNSDKLVELLNKMAEYEEQFVDQCMNENRLPPIEEKYNLEKQFTDLEQELDHVKSQAQECLNKKDDEIAALKQKIAELSLQQKNTCDIGVQTNLVRSERNGLETDTMPFGWSTNQNSLDCTVNNVSCRDYVNPSFVWNKEANLAVPSTTTNSPAMQHNSTPCRPKRTRKHALSNRLPKKEDLEKEEKTETDRLPLKFQGFVGTKNKLDETCVLPMSAVHNLNARVHHLEQRCRHLHMVLRQQHYHAEQMLQKCWQQNRGEKVELQLMLRNSQEKMEHQIRICNDQLERLARTDKLVKDLYVENSYLIANVHRLEKQCFMLSQCNPTCSSV